MHRHKVILQSTSQSIECIYIYIMCICKTTLSIDTMIETVINQHDHFDHKACWLLNFIFRVARVETQSSKRSL